MTMHWPKPSTDWVDWYNHQRLLGSIAYIPPAEAEANFYQHQTGQVMAA